VSKTGIVQIESSRPRWEVEFGDALDRARVKYSEEYFATLNLPAMREKAREQLGPRGAQFVRVFRCRVNPHQKQVFDMDQTKHADEKTESDVNSVLSALWA
jgi:hypothetical protein